MSHNDSCLSPFKVEELRRDLRIKSQELEVKNAAANDKLKKMVKDQQEAEKKKVSCPVKEHWFCQFLIPGSRTKNQSCPHSLASNYNCAWVAW